MRVFWTAFAERQLDDIYAYIQQYSSQSAAYIYNEIVDESASLARFPRIGTIEPLLSIPVREYRSVESIITAGTASRRFATF